MLGELVLGVLIGPSVLGLVGETEVLRVLAQLGALLLLLQAGLETELADLRRVGRAATLIACIGVVLPLGSVYLLLRSTGLDGGGHHIQLYMAAAVTATSVGITARVFGDLRSLGRVEARTVIGAAIADDVIALVVLTVIVRLVAGGSPSPLAVLAVTAGAIGFLAGGTALGSLAMPRVFDWIQRRARSDGTLIALALAFALGFAQLAELVGLAAITGAFVAGTVLARSRSRGAIGTSLGPVAHVFVPVFFLSIGIGADVRALLEPGTLLLAGAIFALEAAGKITAGLLASRRGTDRLLTSFGMVPIGEVALIYAGLGRQVGVLGQRSYGALILVVLASTFATPPLLRWRLARHAPAATAGVPAEVTPTGLPGEPAVAGGVLELTGTPGPGTLALLGLRSARLAAEATPGPRLLAWLSGERGPVQWTAALRAEFEALLAGGNLGSWRLLERTGLLERYLPELARVRAAARARQGDGPWLRLGHLARLAEPGRDRAAAAVWAELERPATLLLAGLVKAVAEGTGTAATVALARRTAQRLDLAVGVEQTLALLTGARADLAGAIVAVDSRDEEQVRNLAATIASAEHARMAYLLAVAEQDAEPGWQDWRRPLLDELLRVVLGALDEPDLIDRNAENLLRRRRAEIERALPDAKGPAAELLREAPRRWLLSQPASQSARQLTLALPPPGRDDLHVAITAVPADDGAAHWRIDTVARDRTGLLADLVAGLTACGLAVGRASASTWPGGLAVDGFEATSPPGTDVSDLEPRLELALRRAAGRRPPGGGPGPPAGNGLPVSVRVLAGATPWHDLVSVTGPDQPGLLLAVLRELAAAGVAVRTVRVEGSNGTLTRVLEVTDEAGNLLDGRVAGRLAARLDRALSRR